MGEGCPLSTGKPVVLGEPSNRVCCRFRRTQSRSFRQEKTSMIHGRLVVLVTLLVPGPVLAQQGTAPKVIKLEPPNLAVEVNAKRIRKLVVTFDRPMRREGYSICGGGPTFPKAKRVRWKNNVTCVMEGVQLEPDHSYSMSLNCQGATNFRSAAGVALEPTEWRFSTLPTKLPNKSKQRALNKRSFAKLRELLASRYSYYDHKKLDWNTIFSKHKDAVLAMRTTRGWANGVAEMLKPANDLHMYLKIGSSTIGTGSRQIDPMYRIKLFEKYLESVGQPIEGVYTAKTKDDIGYMMISSWTDKIDFDKLEKLLPMMLPAKAMIIDVRSNSGGAENMARRVAAWFVKGTKMYAKNVTRVRKGAKGFSPVLSRHIKGNPAHKRYKGPVAVLMSRNCMSGCEAFILMMKQAENCKLIGQRSYGSSGNPRTHDLPNGVKIVLPSWKALRLDGTCFEDEGIAPEIEVKVTGKDFETRDPILEKALEYLRGRM